MMKLKFIMITVLCALPAMLHAQIDKDIKEFDDFVKQQNKEFDDFVEQANQEFAAFLRENWKEYDLEDAIPRPKKPEPVDPVVFDKTKPVPPPQEIKVESVVEAPVPVIRLSGTLPVVERTTPVPVIAGGKTPVARPYVKPETTLATTPKPTVRGGTTPKPDVRPATTPAPTVKPITTPAVKPVTTPTVKPADKPVVYPVQTPDPPISMADLADRPVVEPVAVAKPVAPPVTTPAKEPAIVPGVKPEPVPVSTPTPPVIPAAIPKPTRSGMSFAFYGEECTVNEMLKNRLSLTGIAEKEVAKGWEALCASNYQPLINDCMAIRKEQNLNDWGYLLLAHKTAEGLCGAGRSNEIALTQMFILCQSGYKVKVVRVDNQLTLFFASTDLIYGITYVTIDGTRYYKFGPAGRQGESIFTYNKDFANSRNLVSMNIGNSQLFKGELKKRSLQAKAYPSVKLSSEVNTGLIRFYKDYPQCDYSVYVGAPVSEEVKRSVLPVLREAVRGKKVPDAANLLINFVQTAFEYQTDDQQFGYEKPFFVDELFYYPYCDCEDRSILFSYLVRTLLGLDVVLLDYPQHIATAVHFPEEVPGDYVTISGRKYTICDPTYFGAEIGNAMPQFKNEAVKVLKMPH